MNGKNGTIGKARLRQLKELFLEIAQNWDVNALGTMTMDSALDYGMELGITTDSELHSFGRDGIKIRVVDFAVRRKINPVTKVSERIFTGKGFEQREFSDCDGAIFAYIHKWNHGAGVQRELQKEYEYNARRYGSAFTSKVPLPEETASGIPINHDKTEDEEE